LIWKGVEGYELANKFFTAVQKHSNEQVFDSSVSLLRCLHTAADLKHWSQAAADLPEFVQMEDLAHFRMPTDAERCGMALLGVARIKQGGVINSPAYLRALWRATQSLCVESAWYIQKVGPGDLPRLSAEYDEVVLASGGGIPGLCGTAWPGNSRLSGLRLVRGENLMFPSSITKDEMQGSANCGGKTVFLSGEYAVPYDGRSLPLKTGPAATVSQHLLCGPTHEHITAEAFENTFREQDQLPHIFAAEEGANEVPYTPAQRAVLDRLRDRFPALCSAAPLAAIAGTRLVTNRSELGRLPVVGRLPGYGNVWLHCGLGSRGLVLHALSATYLAQAIQAQDESVIPACLGVLQTRTAVRAEGEGGGDSLD
jgi:glycine/D-amino acid oxidase-like deaminating enzyme